MAEARLWGTHIRRSRDRKHLPAQAIEIRNAVGNLAFAQLHLDARPSAIAKLDDRIDLQSIGILIVPQRIRERIGQSRRINTQVVHAQRFEQKAERLRIAEQPLGTHSEKLGGQRGVGEAALRLSTHARPRANGGIPSEQLVDKIEILEQIEVERNLLPCIFEGVWQTPDNPLAGEHALRNLQRIAPCEGCTSQLLRSPAFPAGRVGHEPLAEGARHHERAAGLLHALVGQVHGAQLHGVGVAGVHL